MVNFTHRLQPFLDFCETVELRDMSQMTRRTAGLYKRDRVEHADLTPSTLQQQLRTFRDFLEYCGKEEAVEGARISLAF